MSDAPMPKINPYVTSRGGVVVLNGPFSAPQAEKVRALCAAAPDLLAELKGAVRLLEGGQDDDEMEAQLIPMRAAIAKAEAGL